MGTNTLAPEPTAQTTPAPAVTPEPAPAATDATPPVTETPATEPEPTPAPVTEPEPAPAPVAEPAKVTAPPEPSPVPVADPEPVGDSEQVKALKTELREALIKAHSVPDELTELLPQDPTELKGYLDSENYKALQAKITPPVLEKHPEGTRAPEPPERSASDEVSQRLTRIGLTLTGGSI